MGCVAGYSRTGSVIRPNDRVPVHTAVAMGQGYRGPEAGWKGRRERNVSPAAHPRATDSEREGHPDRRSARRDDLRALRDQARPRRLGASPGRLVPQPRPRSRAARARRVRHLRVGELHRAHGVRVRPGRGRGGRDHLVGPADPGGDHRAARFGPGRPVPAREGLPARRGLDERRVRAGGGGGAARRARDRDLRRRLLGGLAPHARAADARGAAPLARARPDRAHHGVHGGRPDREQLRPARSVDRDGLLRARGRARRPGASGSCTRRSPCCSASAPSCCPASTARRRHRTRSNGPPRAERARRGVPVRVVRPPASGPDRDPRAVDVRPRVHRHPDRRARARGARDRSDRRRRAERRRSASAG